MSETYRTVYTQKTKHQKRCPGCNKLIADGAKAVGEKCRSTKIYPVKGVMKFVSWRFWHEGCYDKHQEWIAAGGPTDKEARR